MGGVVAVLAQGGGAGEVVDDVVGALGVVVGQGGAADEGGGPLLPALNGEAQAAGLQGCSSACAVSV